MIYKDGTVTVVSGSSIVKGTGTKWNSNNPLVSPGMLMLIKNGDINYPYMILTVNSDTELVLAEEATFSATDTTYTINLTEPNNNSDAARALVAANTYILYFLQNMDTWMGDNGVVEITLPSGKTVKLESINALQELIEKISKNIGNKFDKNSVLQETGTATDKVISQKACDEFYAKKDSWEKFTAGQINIKSNGNYTSLTLIKGDGNKLLLETAPGDAYFVYRDAKNNNKAVVTIPSNKNGTLALTNNPTDITAPKLVVKSPSTHGYIELIAANGNTLRIGSNNNGQLLFLAENSIHLRKTEKQAMKITQRLMVMVLSKKPHRLLKFILMGILKQMIIRRRDCSTTRYRKIFDFQSIGL
ncbi:hypothetical protein ArsFIN_28500 [Arsenophonus nasoniae]|uniref:Phage tail protein n=1 Tax=Arsenophonus nasoniae TaxID=638 RepID=A0A4P7KWC7_9GAMM|nr:hypothetical protein [Arsenophonus nasoniae]QBY44266.1 hypothetical protein ArsFIN_28500 [Arsenophonus nasoniae]